MSRIIFSIFRLFNFRLGPIVILEKIKKHMKLKKENLGRKTTHYLNGNKTVFIGGLISERFSIWLKSPK